MPLISCCPRIRARRKATCSWSSGGISSNRRKRSVDIVSGTSPTCTLELPRLADRVAEFDDHLLIMADLMHRRTAVWPEFGKSSLECDGREISAVVVRHQSLEGHRLITACHRLLLYRAR